jgi:23S rRNA (uracil1939-C5)-methyltransferase
MNKNDIFDLEITDMGVDGEGIGHYEGMTFFVKDALIGDVIRARATKVKKNYGYARVEEVVTPSAFRVEPKCALHRRCGGCQIQALSYEKQLQFKEEKVRNNLLRIGGFAPEGRDGVTEVFSQNIQISPGPGDFDQVSDGTLKIPFIGILVA